MPFISLENLQLTVQGIQIALKDVWNSVKNKANRSELVQSDYTQYDDSKLDYIKNRTHYDTRRTEKKIFTFDGNTEGKEVVIGDRANIYCKITDETYPIDTFLNGKFSVYSNGNIIDNIEITENDINRIGETGKAYFIGGILYVIFDDFTIGDITLTKGIWSACVNNDGTLALYCKSISFDVNLGELKKLDKKYLPLLQSDWNQNDKNAAGYIKNRTHYDDTIYTLRTRQDIANILNDMGISYGDSEAEIIPGITFRIIMDGIIYDNVPIWKGCYYAGGYTWGIGDGVESRGDKKWYSTDYGFCFCGYNDSPILNSDIFPNGIESFEVYTVKKDFKYLDPKYIKDMYYENIEETEIIPEITHEWETLGFEGAYVLDPIDITENTIYKVYWDGILYECTPYMLEGVPALSIGNSIVGEAGTTHNNEPFFIITWEGQTLVFAETIGPHTFKVIKSIYSINHIDPKYIKDMYHEIPEVVTTLRFNEDGVLDSYPWKIDKAYILRIDGIIYHFYGFEYGFYHSASGYDHWYLGTKTTNTNGPIQEHWNASSYPFSIFGPIYYGTNDLRRAEIQFKDGTLNHTVEIIEEEKKIKYLDPKYIKDMYYEDTKKIDISGATYIVNITGSTVQIENPIPLELGQTWSSYRMYRDSGTWSEYRIFEVKQADDGTFYIGDPSLKDDGGSPVIYLTSNELITPDGMVSQGYNTFKFVCDSGYISQKQIKYIDPKYIKDMYGTIDNIILDSVIDANYTLLPEMTYEIGKIYTIEVNGVRRNYECVTAYFKAFHSYVIGFNIVEGDLGVLPKDDNYIYLKSDKYYSISELSSGYVSDRLEFRDNGNVIFPAQVRILESTIKTIDPKYIKDMYYDTRAMEIVTHTFDGNLDAWAGEKVDLNGNGAMYYLKLSDDVPSLTDFVGCTQIAVDDGVSTSITIPEDSTDWYADAGHGLYVTNAFVLVTEVVDGFPMSPGLWAICKLVDGVVVSYTVQASYKKASGELKQLDEKYIPDTIMRTPTEDDALELVAELGLAEPMTDDEGKVLTDENGILFIL